MSTIQPLNLISGIDGPIPALAAVATTGAGNAYVLSRPRAINSMQVSFTGGSPTVKVYLEGSIDGTNWVTLATFDTGAGDASGAIKTSSSIVVNQVRANVATLSGGTSPTVTATILPSAFQ